MRSALIVICSLICLPGCGLESLGSFDLTPDSPVLSSFATEAQIKRMKQKILDILEIEYRWHGADPDTLRIKPADEDGFFHVTVKMTWAFSGLGRYPDKEAGELWEFDYWGIYDAKRRKLNETYDPVPMDQATFPSPPRSARVPCCSNNR